MIEETLRTGHRWLSFPPMLEVRFATEHAESRRRHLLVTSIIGTLIFIGFGFSDPLVMPDVTGLLWESRAVVVPMLAGIIAWSWIVPRPRAREALTTAGILLMASSTNWVIGHSHASTARSHLTVLSLIPMFAGITARMPFRHSLVIALGTVLGAIAFVHADDPIQSLILRDSVMVVISVTLFTLLAAYGLDYRERSRYLLGLLEAEQRQALLHRNRDMRLIFDNVDQALLTINAAGILAEERSAMVDCWFGSYAEPLRFVDYIGATDLDFASAFEVGYEALLEEILPPELCLEQMPKELRAKGRHFRCRYQPLAQAGARQAGLLIIIDDVTVQLRRATEQADQNEKTAILHALMRDRAGLLIFLEEGTDIVDALGVVADLTVQQRFLHTLKGNSAVFGLNALSSLCHEAEEVIKVGGSPEESIRLISERWRSTLETVRPIIGTEREGLSNVSVEDVDRLARRISSGVSTDEVLTELTRWTREPIERGLNRLAQHAVLLARRLGKADLQVEVSAPPLRLDPSRWNHLCSVLVHVVRNAVDHGIETPAERLVAAKSPRPLFAARASSSAHAFVVEIADDGRGIDWARVKQLAAERHLPDATRADLIDALLSPGFSTRADVTATSGRGIGLSAVAHEVHLAGGTIDVISEPGRGTTWRFSFAAQLGA